MASTNEENAERINAVREWIYSCNNRKRFGQSLQRKEGAGEEKERHNQKIHNKLKSLHIIQKRGDHGAKRGKKKRHQKHHKDCWKNRDPAVWMKTK